MSAYAWKIDQDHLDKVEMDPPIYGPRDITPDQEALLDHGGTAQEPVHQFRLYDDDGDLNLSGVFLGDPESEDGFGPLDDYGRPVYGCTYIQYLVDGKWETL